jgi:hypothetical protein
MRASSQFIGRYIDEVLLIGISGEDPRAVCCCTLNHIATVSSRLARPELV